MQITVLGAGYGGLQVVQQLAQSQMQVTLVEPRAAHVLHTRLITAASLRRPLSEVLLPYTKLLPPNVQWCHETAISFDPTHCQVDTDHTSIQADRLVLAMGGRFKPMIAGSETLGLNVYSYEATQQVLAHWSRLQKDLEAQKCDPALLRWVIVGAGKTGIELAAELVHLARRWRNRYGGQAGAIQIYLIEQQEEILPDWRPSLRVWVRRWLTRHHVLIQTATRVKRARAGYIVLNQSEELPTQTLFWATGKHPVILEEEPPELRDQADYMPVNDRCQLRDFPAVFALGGLIRPLYAQTGQMLHPSLALTMQAAQTIISYCLDQESQTLFMPSPPNMTLALGAFDGAAMLGEQDLTGTAAWAISQGADTLYYNSIKNWQLPRLNLPIP